MVSSSEPEHLKVAAFATWFLGQGGHPHVPVGPWVGCAMMPWASHVDRTVGREGRSAAGDAGLRHHSRGSGLTLAQAGRPNVSDGSRRPTCPDGDQVTSDPQTVTPGDALAAYVSAET
jgi:hypothetical protein